LRFYFARLNNKKPLFFPDELTYLDIDDKEKPFPSLFDKSSIYLSIVIPAYNEAKRITPMLDEAFEYLNKRYESEPEKI